MEAHECFILSDSFYPYSKDASLEFRKKFGPYDLTFILLCIMLALSFIYFTLIVIKSSDKHEFISSIIADKGVIAIGITNVLLAIMVFSLFMLTSINSLNLECLNGVPRSIVPEDNSFRVEYDILYLYVVGLVSLLLVPLFPGGYYYNVMEGYSPALSAIHAIGVSAFILLTLVASFMAASAGVLNYSLPIINLLLLVTFLILVSFKTASMKRVARGDSLFDKSRAERYEERNSIPRHRLLNILCVFTQYCTIMTSIVSILVCSFSMLEKAGK